MCEEAFTQSTGLQRHVKLHTGDKSYNCPYCGKMLKTNTHLERHVGIHTGAKPYSCRHLFTAFYTAYNLLKRHLLKSHNEGTWFTCNICQKKFTTNGVLKEHLLRHEGVNPYVCSQCRKRFCTVRVNWNLISWYTWATNKQFCCGLCSKGFKRKYAVVHHSKKCSNKPIFSDV